MVRLEDGAGSLSRKYGCLLDEYVDVLAAAGGHGLDPARLVVVAVAPSVAGALPALVLVGAACVHVEVLATRTLQRSVPDAARGSALGLTDCSSRWSAGTSAGRRRLPSSARRPTGPGPTS